MDENPVAPVPQAKPRRRWHQFSLRTLLIGVTVFGTGVGWLGNKVREARQQAADVAAIERRGGQVIYDYEFDGQRDPAPHAALPSPVWLRSLLGDDLFRNVASVEIYGSTIGDADLECLKRMKALKRFVVCGSRVTDAGMEHLKGLMQLKTLQLAYTSEVTDAGWARLQELTQLKSLNLHNTRITDAGLEHLAELTQLTTLDLHGTQVTDTGVAKLQQALPKCKIEY